MLTVSLQLKYSEWYGPSLDLELTIEWYGPSLDLELTIEWYGPSLDLELTIEWSRIQAMYNFCVSRI